MNAEQIIVTETIRGATTLLEQGILGALAFVGLGVLLWVAYTCSTNTKKGLDNNTEALNGVKVMLGEIKGRLEK